ncbi:hypothetical protein GF359_03090 [candidate division WOR-3 bacterium]|uniref:Uncharacterized protein n=1 Tax=candidate division WOR-3 bacterium TaxID=2052148 RepID=A0A9D5K9R6_UNCW3|nr:hypothetical protein [candidate division WOR-3 bacterium]MBD3364180.1 hypothetical protein [candidate division WOR-3 bacterium]
MDDSYPTDTTSSELTFSTEKLRFLSGKNDSSKGKTGASKDTFNEVREKSAKSGLEFNNKGICHIHLRGLPKPAEIEKLIEDYVTEVELGPYPLKVILLDISELVHMQILSRRAFSEFLAQASNHYGDAVEVVIAAGPPMIRKYTEILCRALKFGQRTVSFDDIEAAEDWIRERMYSA